MTRTIRGKRQGKRKGELITVDSLNAVVLELAKMSADKLIKAFGGTIPVRAGRLSSGS